MAPYGPPVAPPEGGYSGLKGVRVSCVCPEGGYSGLKDVRVTHGMAEDRSNTARVSERVQHGPRK